MSSWVNLNAKKYVRPTLGYATKSAAILALREQGKTYGEIGKLVGMKPKEASALASRAKQRASRVKRTIELEGNIFLDIEREAVKRGLPVEELARKLLVNITVDKLFDAVLAE